MRWVVVALCSLGLAGCVEAQQQALTPQQEAYRQAMMLQYIQRMQTPQPISPGYQMPMIRQTNCTVWGNTVNCARY